MSDVIIVVPRRADLGHRDRLWTFTRALWADLFPDYPIYEGHHDRGPFSRSAAINRAVASVGSDWEVVMIIDADVLPDPAGIEAAIKIARTGQPASGFNIRRNLSKAGTDRILAGYRGSWERYVANQHPHCISGAFAVNHKLWDMVRGFDERFIGWGFEDTAFEVAAETMAGQTLYRAEPPLWHLWHPKSPEHNTRLDNYKRNRTLRDEYLAARGNRMKMGPLLEAALRVQSGERILVPPPTRSVTIPRILHRTVPAETSEEVERWWRDAGHLHPSWELMDHREPLDPAMWPETGDIWADCKSGAQKAGLIRLEALFRYGGVYIDSDVELYRSLEPLLTLEGFAGWEDRNCAPDAVLGFRPGHPALAIMLEKARASIERGEGAWDSGPGVTTSTLPGRDDVLMLPPGSFYPYHYKEKHRRVIDHASEQPWAFGAHHWAHSWRGK